MDASAGDVVVAQSSDDLSSSARFQRRRQEVIDVSARVFASNGYHGTGTIQLCEANQIGKAALYHYIGSKEQLLAAICQRVMDEVMLGGESVARSKAPPPEQLKMLGRKLIDVIMRFPDHVWVWLHDGPFLTGDMAQHLAELREEYERRVEAILEAGIESRDFREMNVHIAARAWLAVHTHFYTHIWLKAGALSPKLIASTLHDIFVRGVAVGT